jgi:N-acetylneuraminic acid mutarotase
MTDDGETAKFANVFDTVKGEWTKTEELPGDRMNGFTPATAVLDKTLYAAPADGKIYRLEGGSWKETASLKAGRWVHRTVALDANTLLVLGGASKDGNKAECETVRVR